MALTRLNNRSVSAVTALPSGIDIPAGVIVPADLPVGSILQVVNVTTNTQYSTTSTSLVATGFSATITPKFSTSKILVVYTCGGIETSTTAGGVKGYISIYKAGNSLKTVSNAILWNATASAGPAATFFDSPNSTATQTYDLYFASISSSYTWYVGTNSSLNTFTLLEVAA